MAAETSPDTPGDDERDAAPRPENMWRQARFQIAAILTVGVCLVASLWLIIFVMIDTERRAAIEHASNEANNLSAAFQAEVADKLDAIVRAMDFVATRMRADPGFDLNAWMRENSLLTTTAMRSAAILSPDGRRLSSTMDPHPAPLDLSDREYFRVHLDGTSAGTFISRLEVGRVSGRPSIHVSRRVEAEDGRFLGVIIASLAPNQLTALPRAADIGARSVLALVGSDNVIRARFSADNEDGTLGAGTQVSPLPASDGTPVRSFIKVSTFDRVTRLYSMRDLAGYPLHAVVAFDLTQILQPPAQRARLIRAIGITATLMLGGLLVLLVIAIRRGTDRAVKLAHEQIRLAAEIRHGNQVQQQLRASEARLRDYARMASDWFWEQDAELRFTEIGVEAPAIIFGDRSQFGKCRWEIADTSQAPERWANHKRDLLARMPFRDFRYSLTGPDAKLRHFSVNGVPVYDDAGQFVGYRGTGRDITAEVETEAELRKAKDRAEQAETLLRDAVDSISEGFVIYDREDRFVLCNQAYRDLFRLSSRWMQPGARFEDIVRHGVADHPDAAGREDEYVAERLRAHREATGDLEQMLADGRWLLITERRMRSGGIAGLRIDVTALKQAQAALQVSQERLDRAQAIAGIGSWELDVATGHYIWSKELYRIRGLSPENFAPNIDNVAAYVHPDDYPAVRRWLAELIAGRKQDAPETRIIRPDGEVRVLRVEGRAVTDPDGVIRRLAGTMQDITEQRLIEQQLIQAQKMEAIGNLTGGMAHDFNNGLGIIIGNLDLLGRLVESDRTAAELCDEAREGALRCADLVRRLLAFARRQPLQPQQTDVNALVESMARLLSRTLGEDIEVTLHLGTALWPVVADPAQLEAALTNLATNARDAMPRGGKLDITTRTVELDAHYAALHPEANPGAYVLIEVTDTGTGIAPEIIGHIFEPFFTNKKPGQGSGLGLSMVFGFVKQSGGHLTVHSEPGRGSTFRIYLPRAEVGDAQAATPADRQPVVGGDETVLVVEDNAPLRQATARQLAELGYQVREAEHADAALAILFGGDRVDLLFTDVVMPGAMDGLDLAHQATRMRPDLKVLLTSGFPVMRGAGQRMAGCPFVLLNKPYRHDELARAVREVLDRGDDRATTTAMRPVARADRSIHDSDRTVVAEQV